jgi:hypothetical protein
MNQSLIDFAFFYAARNSDRTAKIAHDLIDNMQVLSTAGITVTVHSIAPLCLGTHHQGIVRETRVTVIGAASSRSS